MVKMLRVLFRSGRNILPSCLTSLSRYGSTTRVLHENFASPPDESLSIICDSDNPRLFNPNAIIDLGYQKFDDDLLYFPETLDEDEWMELVGRGDVIEKELADINYGEILSTGKIEPDVLKKIGALQLFRLKIPKKYGGLGYNDTACKYIHEIVGQYPSIARLIGENEEMGIRLLVEFGSEAQKEKYLPRLAKGESMISAAILEEGSSLFNLKSYQGTQAVQEGEKFIITGKKHWTYNAKYADVFLVLASHKAEDNHGIFNMNTIFIVDRKSEGVRVHKPIKKTWFKGLDLCEVIFDEVEVGFENILGGLGNGFNVLRHVIKQNRTLTLSECAAAMKRLLHDLVYKAQNQKLSNKPLSEHKHCEMIVGSMSCLTYAVESVGYYMAARNDYYYNSDLKLESWLAKIFTYQTIPEALQMYFNAVGRHGYQTATFIEELVQNSHYYPILDDSINDMKLYLMYEMLPHLGKEMATTVRHKMLSFDYPKEELTKLVKNELPLPLIRKPQLNLRSCVPNEMAICSEQLAWCIERLSHCIELQFRHDGRVIMNNDLFLTILADMWTQIYVLIACIARTSRVLCAHRIRNKEEKYLTQGLAERVVQRVEVLAKQIERNHEEMVSNCKIGRRTLTNKSYLAEHPLMRNF